MLCLRITSSNRASATKVTKTDTARPRYLKVVSIPQHKRTPHSYYSEQICGNVVLITASGQGSMVKDYLISSKPSRKPEAESSSLFFTSQFPTEDEPNLEVNLYMRSSSISSWNKKIIIGVEQAKKRKQTCSWHHIHDLWEITGQVVVWMLASSLFIKAVRTSFSHSTDNWFILVGAKSRNSFLFWPQRWSHL